MKKINSLLLLSALALGATAQTDVPYLTKSLASAGIQHVQAETSGGNIAVTGDAADAKIEVYIRSNNGNNNLPKEEIQKRLSEDYEFSITTDNNKLVAIARPKDRSGRWNWKKALSISFKIFVPRNVTTDLTTSGGNVNMAHLTGNQEFQTSGGNLTLDDLTGKIKGTTSGGNIHFSNLKDDITLRTSGGNVTARNSSGKLNISTSGGNVTMESLKGDIDASTSGGTVRGSAISGSLAAVTSGGNITLEDLSCSVDASTSGGNMQVVIKELGSFVKLTNSGGNINLEMPGNKGLDLKITGDKVKVSPLNNFSGTVEEDYVGGKVNGGGIPITVKGSSGRITLSIK